MCRCNDDEVILDPADEDPDRRYIGHGPRPGDSRYNYPIWRVKAGSRPIPAMSTAERAARED